MADNYGRNYQALAHAWVHNTDKDFYGYCYGYRMSANQDTVYSYGSHYPIAKKYKNVVFFNGGRTSATTSRHQYITERAIYQPLYKVSLNFIKNISKISAIEEIKDQDTRATYIARLLQKARSHNSITEYQREIHEIVRTIDYLIKEFRVKSKLPKHLKNLSYQFYTGEEFKERELKKSNRKIAEQEKSTKKWRKGETNFICTDRYDLLRIVKNDVQSSQGVKLGIGEFKRLYQLLKRKSVLGQKVGNTSYTVLSVTEKKVVIGCHHIERKEIEMVAKKLKIK